jgi:hypothetical protein
VRPRPARHGSPVAVMAAVCPSRRSGAAEVFDVLGDGDTDLRLVAGADQEASLRNYPTAAA